MVPIIKRCERCYKPISYEETDDWYRHIRVQYCDDCRKIVDKEQAAARFRRYKERQKEAARLRDERLKELEIENEILREKLKLLWDSRNHKKEGES